MMNERLANMFPEYRSSRASRSSDASGNASDLSDSADGTRTPKTVDSRRNAASRPASPKVRAVSTALRAGTPVALRRLHSEGNSPEHNTPERNSLRLTSAPEFFPAWTPAVLPASPRSTKSKHSATKSSSHVRHKSAIEPFHTGSGTASRVASPSPHAAAVSSPRSGVATRVSSGGKASKWNLLKKNHDSSPADLAKMVVGYNRMSDGRSPDKASILNLGRESGADGNTRIFSDHVVPFLIKHLNACQIGREAQKMEAEFRKKYPVDNDDLYIDRDGYILPNGELLRPFVKPLADGIMGPDRTLISSGLPKALCNFILAADRELTELCLSCDGLTYADIVQAREALTYNLIFFRGMTHILNNKVDRTIQDPFKALTQFALKFFKEESRLFLADVIEQASGQLTDKTRQSLQFLRHGVGLTTDMLRQQERPEPKETRSGNEDLSPPKTPVGPPMSLASRQSPVSPTKARAPASRERVEALVKTPAVQDDDRIDDVRNLQFAIETALRRASFAKIMNDSEECKRIKAFGPKAEAQFYEAINRLIDRGGEITNETLESVYHRALERHAIETQEIAVRLFNDLDLVTKELKRVNEVRDQARNRRHGSNRKRRSEI